MAIMTGAQIGGASGVKPFDNYKRTRQMSVSFHGDEWFRSNANRVSEGKNKLRRPR